MNPPVADDELDLSHHLKMFTNFIGHGNEEADLYFAHQAQHVHSLVVHDALRDGVFEAVTTVHRLKEEEAKHFMTFGVARRLKMMWASYREILSHIRPERKEPLDEDEIGPVERDLNVIYINIRGILDNLAFCLQKEVATENTKNMNPRTVDLFSVNFMADPNFADIRASINAFEDWNREMKTRRDPSAHRIPLTVPPAFLNDDEAKRYRDFDTKFNDALSKHDLDAADKYSAEMRRLGTFNPCFVHHLDEGLLPIFPTIPDDIATLVKISRIVFAFLQARRA